MAIPGRTQRPRRALGPLGVLRVVGVVGVVGLLGGTLAACGSDEADPGGGGSTSSTTMAETSTTTVPPLERPVVDACGNDLGALTSTVWGVDAATGAVRWSTSVPLADSFLLRSAQGEPQLSLVLRPVEAVLDLGTGAIAETPAAGVHEVLVDVTGATESGTGGLLVDGEPQPVTIDVDGRSISTARGEVGQTTVTLTAEDGASAAPLWSVDLGPADTIASLSPPVAYGDTVVVVASPPRPTCP